MSIRTKREVLVIEDDPDTLTLLRTMIESWGYDVVAVDNVLKGLQSL